MASTGNLNKLYQLSCVVLFLIKTKYQDWLRTLSCSGAFEVEKKANWSLALPSAALLVDLQLRKFSCAGFRGQMSSALLEHTDLCEQIESRFNVSALFLMLIWAEKRMGISCKSAFARFNENVSSTCQWKLFVQVFLSLFELGVLIFWEGSESCQQYQRSEV